MKSPVLNDGISRWLRNGSLPIIEARRDKLAGPAEEDIVARTGGTAVRPNERCADRYRYTLFTCHPPMTASQDRDLIFKARPLPDRKS